MMEDDEELLICRVCLVRLNSQDKCFNIFEQLEDPLSPGTSKDDVRIADKLTACADVKIKNDDGLPNLICSRCLLEVEHAYNFKRKCEKSDEILRIASKNNPNIKYEEVSVKEESDTESENSVFDDNVTPLQGNYFQTECIHTPLVENIKLNNDKQQINEVLTNSIHTADNNSVVPKIKDLKLECHECGHIFKSKCKLSVHQRKEHSKLPIACSYCKLQFKSIQAYQNHQRNRPKVCISLSDLRIEGVGVSRHFYCKECEYNTKSANNAMLHLIVHNKNSQYKCDQCDMSFLRTTTLRAHKERTHKHYYGEKTCHICGKFFKGFTSYDYHMRTHRERNRSHCEICNTNFSSQSSLYTHKKTHSNLKPIACQKCPAKFRTSAGLYSHKKVHSDEIVACKVCGYKVKNRYKVRKHENEHNDQNVACRLCGKFFNSETQLALHMKSHDRCHSCSYCDKTYTARKNLTEHLRKVHQIYVSSSDLKGINHIKRVKKNKSDVTTIKKIQNIKTGVGK